MSRHQKSEPWYVRSWRPAAAYVYMFICMSDFVFMPMYAEAINHKVQADKVVELALKFPPGPAQIEALKAVRETRNWDPLTLKENSMFHIAFLSILGVAAWTRGQEKIQLAKSAKPDATGGAGEDPNNAQSS